MTVSMRAPTVVLTIAGGKHLAGRYPELLQHYKQRAKLPFAVVAMDEETHEYFANHSAVSMFFDLPTLGVKEHVVPMGWPSREAIMRGKYELTSLLLDRGITVVLSELDIYWKKNPLVLQSEIKGDFLVTQHQYDRTGEVNVGFYIAKPTPNARRTFSNLRTWLNSDLRGETPCGGCFDQVLLDFAIRCSPRAKLATKCSFPQVEQDILCDMNSTDRLVWNYIPWEKLPHPPLHHRYGANDTAMQEFMTALNSAYGTHLWSGFAHPDEQMAFAYDNGFWARGVPPPPPVDPSKYRLKAAQYRAGDKEQEPSEAPCSCDDLVD